MGAKSSLAIGGGIVVLFVLLVCAPLIIYHFLISPNIDGVFNDLSFYEADEESSHFLYWFFFWGVTGIGTSFVIGFTKK